MKAKQGCLLLSFSLDESEATCLVDLLPLILLDPRRYFEGALRPQVQRADDQLQ